MKLTHVSEVSKTRAVLVKRAGEWVHYYLCVGLIWGFEINETRFEREDLILIHFLRLTIIRIPYLYCMAPVPLT